MRVTRLEIQYNNWRLVTTNNKITFSRGFSYCFGIRTKSARLCEHPKGFCAWDCSPGVPGGAILTWVFKNQIIWKETRYFVANEWGKEIATLAMPWGVVETFLMRSKTAHYNREVGYPAPSLGDIPASETPWVQGTEALFTRVVCYLWVERRRHKRLLGDRGNHLHRPRIGTPLMDSSL